MEIEDQAPRRPFQAFVWPVPDEPAKRFIVEATDIEDAVHQVKQMYGQDAVYSVYNEEDSAKPR